MKKFPFWFPTKKNIYWYILFTVIFLLSLDFWEWNNFEPLFLGLPVWMYFFIILTLLTSVAFFIFSKYYWEEKK